MKRFNQIIFLAIVGFIWSSCSSQPVLNSELKKELDYIMFTDQAFRRQYDPDISEQERRNIADSLKMDYDTMRRDLLVLMNKYDRENIKKIGKIISKYGYPGKSLVGEPTNQAAYLVIQHSDEIPKYLPLVKKAAAKKELPFRNYATMLDRYLMNKGKEQLYGTQGLDMGGNEIIWPVKNPQKVNRLRKKAGFTQTIEESAKEIYGKSFEYKIYTLEEVKKMFSGYTIYYE